MCTVAMNVLEPGAFNSESQHFCILSYVIGTCHKNLVIWNFLLLSNMVKSGLFPRIVFQITFCKSKLGENPMVRKSVAMLAPDFLLLGKNYAKMKLKIIFLKMN
jgi:hypothetical protein